MCAASSPQLETERLLLRRFQDADLPSVVEMNSDPDVMRFIGNGQVATEQQSHAMIAKQEAQWDEKGFAFFAVQERSSGETVGLCGINIPYFYPEILPAVEIGWRFRRPFWGQGYATEAAHAALDFGLNVLEVSTIYGFANPDNVPSLRVMDKIGMSFQRTIHISKYDLSAQLYAVHK